MNATQEMLSPVLAGTPAPEFALPAIDGSGTISLQDFRGRSALFLALFVGLWCPFCRRSIAEVAGTEPALKEQGVETLCIVATPPENARLYFKYRPTRLRLAADPGLRREDVLINLVEVKTEDWSFGLGVGQYIQG